MEIKYDGNENLKYKDNAPNLLLQRDRPRKVDLKHAQLPLL